MKSRREYSSHDTCHQFRLQTSALHLQFCKKFVSLLTIEIRYSRKTTTFEASWAKEVNSAITNNFLTGSNHSKSISCSTPVYKKSSSFEIPRITCGSRIFMGCNASFGICILCCASANERTIGTAIFSNPRPNCAIR